MGKAYSRYGGEVYSKGVGAVEELADGGRVVGVWMLQSTTKFLHIQLLKTMLPLWLFCSSDPTDASNGRRLAGVATGFLMGHRAKKL